MNIAPLKAGADSEQLARRVGQKALRSAAALFGLSPCPFPLCVLVNYPNVESLDDMSGNYCPPCKDRLLRRAEELNLSIAAPAAD